MFFGINYIRRLVDIVNEHELSSLEVSFLFWKVSISSHNCIYPPLENRTTKTIETKVEDTNLVEVKSEYYIMESPMVGTFYLSSSKEDKPSVKINDKVSEGQTICYIEAMKLMNDIKSEYDGTVREIYVKKGSPVEFGQSLFGIEIRD